MTNHKLVKKGDRIAVSVDLDADLWKEFSNMVDEKKGRRKKTVVIAKLVSKYVKKQKRKGKRKEGKGSATKEEKGKVEEEEKAERTEGKVSNNNNAKKQQIQVQRKAVAGNKT